MKTIHHTLLVLGSALGFVFLSPAILAQTPYLANQITLNPFNTNPAAAGIYRYVPIQMTVRQQWLGMNAAPSVRAVSMHANLKAAGRTYNPAGFLNKGKHSFGKVGVGGGVFNFSHGSISQTGLHLDYAYHIFLGRGRLSLGLAPMYHQFRIDKSKFIMPDGDDYDPVIHDDPVESLHFFDANVGAHYYSDLLFAGISIIQMFNSRAMFGTMSYERLDDPNQNPYLARCFYAYAGLTMVAGDWLGIEPTLMASYNQAGKPGLQAGLQVRIAEIVEAGVVYVVGESLGFTAGTTFNLIQLKYLFQTPLGDARNAPFNTHQLMAGYLLQQSW